MTFGLQSLADGKTIKFHRKNEENMHKIDEIITKYAPK
jgi:hypothetical protein